MEGIEYSGDSKQRSYADICGYTNMGTGRSQTVITPQPLQARTVSQVMLQSDTQSSKRERLPTVPEVSASASISNFVRDEIAKLTNDPMLDIKNYVRIIEKRCRDDIRYFYNARRAQHLAERSGLQHSPDVWTGSETFATSSVAMTEAETLCNGLEALMRIVMTIVLDDRRARIMISYLKQINDLLDAKCGALHITYQMGKLTGVCDEWQYNDRVKS